MFVLSNGEYTGQTVNSLSDNDVTISTSHYSVDECRRGLHCHENPHISFLFQGGDVERRKNRTYERKTGDVYFYYSGELHSSVSRTTLSKNINIEFGKGFLQRHALSESRIEESIKSNSGVKFPILKLQQEMLINDGDSPLSIQTLLLELVNHSSRSGRSVPKWVHVLRELLDDKWSERLTLHELSLETATHPVTISKHFRKYFSCTLGEYLRKLKIDKSIPLIKNTTMSLTEIANYCGFADQSHFTRNFKHLTGFLPKEFRSI